MNFSVRWKAPKRSNPKLETHYRKYKPVLQEDFHLSCGYCGIHHVFFGSGSGFHIDHFAPKSIFEEQEHIYTNLVYACPVCNIAKSNHWAGLSYDQCIVNGEGFIDPCDITYDDCFYRDSSGKIRYQENNSVAKYMHKKMKFSLRRHEIFWLTEYLLKLVTILDEKINDLGEMHPLYADLKSLHDESVKEMIKYQNLIRQLKSGHD